MTLRSRLHHEHALQALTVARRLGPPKWEREWSDDGRYCLMVRWPDAMEMVQRYRRLAQQARRAGR
jgi:hypothetical protein